MQSGPGKTRKGIILLADGTWHDLPDPVIDQEEITWQLGMPEVRSGEPVRMLSPKDFYRRHELIPGEFYVFLNDSDLAS